MKFKYKKIDETFITEAKERITIIEEKVQELLKIENKTYANFIDPIEHLFEDFDTFTAPLGIENSSFVTEIGQKIYGEFLPIYSEFTNNYSQNEDIAKATIDIYENEELSPERRRFLEASIRGFKSSGIGLPENEKKKIKEISLELSQLQNDFSQNLIKAINSYELIIEDEKILGEMPELEKKSAETEDKKWKFTLHAPSYTSFMKYCIDRTLREDLYKAFSTRALENEDIIEKVSKLRDEKAKILGFKNFRELSIASKTASNANEVISFLEELGTIAYPAAKKECEDLAKFAKEELGIEEFNYYDFSLVSRKYKEKYFNFDPASVKPYFEKNSVVQGMFDFLKESLNLESKEVKVEGLWHDKVVVYELSRNGEFYGNLITDLETNSQKNGGAWANKIVASYIKDGKRVPAIASITCNFPESKDGVPSLLTHDDIVTLFHEMGHALHNITSNVEDVAVSGFNNCEWDVIEYPSQWLQEFAKNKNIIKTFAKHYETGEVIPDQLIDKMLEAEYYGEATGNNRQIEFGLFDLKIFDRARTKEEIQSVLDEVRTQFSPLTPPSYNKFQCSFSHIFAGGYGAGYYSYKWAEVLSADSYLEMTKDEKLDKELMNRFFDTLIRSGGSTNMKETFVKVHGRKPDPKALLRLKKII